MAIAVLRSIVDYLAKGRNMRMILTLVALIAITVGATWKTAVAEEPPCKDPCVCLKYSLTNGNANFVDNFLVAGYLSPGSYKHSESTQANRHYEYLLTGNKESRDTYANNFKCFCPDNALAPVSNPDYAN